MTENFLGEDISPDTEVEAVFDTVRDRYQTAIEMLTAIKSRKTYYYRIINY
ncbi:MAG: hypothetical protein F6K54_22470 [Okeania sp. SIO3B5]|uniref:hypothetical protein n=1 Tax=Okeania sp. SIO3B5 TaxID=2607811 RepID=UPI001400FB49|nr:hypothetical protein [Okeania sp. SIO3B5]NEO55594.1 hypothetical protein [Okeania sp. SIO3B5]